MILLVLFSVVCMSFTILMYFRYAKPCLPWFTTLTVIASWFITFSIAFIIPFDIYLGYYPNDAEADTVKLTFYIFYFSVQILSLLVLPTMTEYEKAGDFTVKERLYSAIKKNLLLYSVAALVGLAITGYLLLKSKLTL